MHGRNFVTIPEEYCTVETFVTNSGGVLHGRNLMTMAGNFFTGPVCSCCTYRLCSIERYSILRLITILRAPTPCPTCSVSSLAP